MVDLGESADDIVDDVAKSGRELVVSRSLVLPLWLGNGDEDRLDIVES